ncbi:hypothetical protein HaLaN_28242, partial [Haematococcus lacustris]
MPILVSGSRVTLVSSPGIEYAVTVRNVDNVSFIAFPYQSVGLKVDGKAIGTYSYSVDAGGLAANLVLVHWSHVGYNATLRAHHPSYKFTGYMGGPGCQPNQLTNFKFAAAQTLTATSAEDVSNIQDLKHGKLQLELWQSQEAPKKARPAAAVV